MPANKRQDQNGWYPKLAVKIACQKKFIPAKIGYQPKATISQMPVQAKICCQSKNGCQPNVAASQKQLTAKCQCKLKVAASQKGLPAKVAASQTWLPDKRGFQPNVASSETWLPAKRDLSGGKHLVHCQLCEKYFKKTKIVFFLMGNVTKIYWAMSCMWNQLQEIMKHLQKH